MNLFGQAMREMGRFAVAWLVPKEPDRLTHVMLLDTDRPAPHTLSL
jgi:hypothetical protein